ncbi:MAG: metal-dependent transcriptional regulator [Eggerthellaceae bacterium]|nr:metal-dependent transcriptional regulator [Eggerthellaceae bacterium]
MASAPKVTESHEDYLEAIVMLGGTDKVSVRPVDVANKLGVSKASVNKAVSVLRDAGMLDQPYYGDITLTKQGYKYGSSVFERHKTLTRFFVAIGVDEKTAEEEACMVEHDISEKTFRKWASFIEEKKM